MSQNIFKIYDGRTSFWQYDTGQKLIVLDRTIDQLHFSNTSMNKAIVKEVYVDDNGMRLCDVPDMILKMPKPLIAYAYVMGDDNNKTICAVKFSVSPRPIPEDYTYEENNRFKDLVDKIESVQDVLESGGSVKKFNTLSYAEEWAQDYQAAGTIISAWNGTEWALYMVENDYRLYQIGDTDQLIIDVDRLQDLVGEKTVEEQIRLTILALNLPNTYEPIGAANVVRGELKEEVNRAKNEEAAITRELHKINNNVSNLQDDIQKNKDDISATIKVITDDYLNKADKTELERKIKSNTDAIDLLTNGVDADKIDGLNDLFQYVDEHGAEVTGIKSSIKSNTDAIAAEKSRAQSAEAALDRKIKEVEASVGDNKYISTLIEDAMNEAKSHADSLNNDMDVRVKVLEDMDISSEPADDDIPKVFFGGALQQTKDEAVVPFRYISKTDDFSGYAEIKAQGNSSMNYPKKNQTVKLFKDADCTEKLKIDFKGWGKQNKHVYKANWIDLSHARNIVSARLWADVVKSRANLAELPELLRTSPNYGAVDGFPVKVYAAGVYQGRYTLNIPKDKWTFNMDDKLDSHCVLCGENYASGCFRASAQINESDWTDEIHDTVPASIKTRWNEVISFVMNSTDEEFRANLGNYFFVDSLIDYYLFGLASCGLDAFGKNQIYATYDGQKWLASMYDMDSTWGLYWNGSKFVATDYARTSYEDFVSTASSGEGNLLYIRLEQLFWSELQTRWAELKNGALSIDNIINRFERFTDIAPADLVKEDYASTTGGGKFTGIPSKDTNNIQQIRSFALARQAWTDDYVSALNGGGEVEPDEPDVPVEPDEPVVEGHTVLSYIESSGTQYIDTGISGGTNAAWEIQMNSLDTAATTWEQYFAGAKPSTVPNLGDSTPNATPSRRGISSSCITADSNVLCAKEDAVHTFRYDGTNAVYADGTAVAPLVNDPTGNGWGDLTWYVFNSHGEPNLASSMRLYYLKMWTDGVLVRDFIPVQRNADNVICLYDKVTNTYFENIGTGEFISGGELPDTPSLPTEGLLYSLPQATTFSGTAGQEIDTGVKLFDTDKPFTVLLDWTHTTNDFTNNSGVAAHCANEASPYPGLFAHYTGDGFTMQMRQNTGVLNARSLSDDKVANADFASVKAAYIKSADGTLSIKRRYNNAGDILTSSNKFIFTSVTQNLILGCYQTATGEKGRYVKGILNDCKVYDGVLSDAEIEAYLNA